MRIGMLADTYKPHISGITNYIDLNKRYLEKAGHEVFVFTFGDQDYADEETGIIRSPGLPLVDTGYYLSFRYSRPAKALLQTMDVAHVHHPFLSGRLALHYCRPLHIPVIFTNHTRYDLYAQAYLPGLPEDISEALLESYMPNFCSAVNRVISPSAGMAQVLRKFKVEAPIAIVPNGVELDRFLNAAPLFERAELGLTDEDLLLIYVGRLGPEKNLAFLLKAFAGVAEAVDKAHLLLVGDGPEREKLLEQAAQSGLLERVHFIGPVEYEQIPAYLAMCSGFVTASVSEVHPLSVIEAMAAGLPVMGIQSVGVGDTVLDGVTGFLSSESLPAFTAKLTHLCLDTSLRLTMGQAARQQAARYAIEQTNAAMLGHYEQLRNQSLGQPARQFLGETPPMKHNQAIGKWGEAAAADYLGERGYQILDRNTRTPYGEIDLVAELGGLTVFVEVKARTTRRFGLPEEAVTPRKLAHMRAAAEFYAAEHEIDAWQLDVLAVEGIPGVTPRIEHFENV